ncbi:MAG TPA: alpha/beta hydrolase, partial [Thermohalobaculum sp.]|nr:alpha/beta hydrolase [Thermohalobaculum sp.]
MLQIRVVGPFEVLAGGVQVEMPPSRKTRALLAYLALADRPVRRERLCEIFWELPDDPKGALRWSLSKIRRAVNGDGADRILSDRSVVALDRAGVGVDWLDLRQAAADGLEDLPDARLEALAATLRGGFLEDLDLSRCPDYEAWRLGEAAQVEAAAARLLRLLVERLEGEPGRALPHALRLRAFVPDPEEADALVARLRQGVGRR